MLLVLSLPATSLAQERPRRLGEPVDTWSDPNPGVRYLRRTYDEPPVEVHALIVDLHHEGVRVITTPQAERWGTVSDFAQRHEAAAAINGGFWSMWQVPSGIAAGGGELWDNSAPDPDFGHFAILTDGRAVVHGPGEGEDERSLARVTDALSGRPIVVTRGEVDAEQLDAFQTANQRQPRTAVGASRGGDRAFIVVVDGRQDHSRGFTLYQLARVMVELGADRAINLDGGGSSTMFVRGAGGIVSSPSRGRWQRALGLAQTQTSEVRTADGVREVFVRGQEREVQTHLAVIAPPPRGAVAVDAHRSALGDGLGAPTRASFVAPRAEPLRLGRARELLYPALYVGVPGLGLLLGLWLARRLSSRRGARRAPSAGARTVVRSSRT